MIYFDNAATTPLDPAVKDRMCEVINGCFGNPSSIHAFGREAKVLLEESREMIANYLHVTPSELYFTSSGTEAINMAIHHCLVNENYPEIILSPLEHHAVLHTAEKLAGYTNARMNLVLVDNEGRIDLNHLEELLSGSAKPCLLCLMHANNEISNLLPLKDVAMLCQKYNTTFLCDTVQSICKYKINLDASGIHYAPCSAHKFHGPKGAGLLYVRKGQKISPVFYGGGQERGIRPSTENIYGIVGMAKAFEVAHKTMDENIKYISGLRSLMISRLKDEIPEVSFNGECESGGLYTILNVAFPKSSKSEMLLYRMDMEGIAVSGGSACTSGSATESHVLKAMNVSSDRVSVRISFSKMNTVEEVEKCVSAISSVLKQS